MAGETLQERLTEQFLARRADRWVVGAIAVLLVAVGFIGGRWTSLTNNATPIVFQEAPEGESSEASEAALDALVAGSTVETLREESTASEGAQNIPASTNRRTTTNTSENTQSEGAFVASVNGKKYYYPDCAEVKRIKEENLIWFDSEEEATESGYEPSACNLKRQE